MKKQIVFSTSSSSWWSESIVEAKTPTIHENYVVTEKILIGK